MLKLTMTHSVNLNNIAVFSGVFSPKKAGCVSSAIDGSLFGGHMKILALNQSYTTIVDDEDYELLSLFKWVCHNTGYNFYIYSNINCCGKVITLALHRLLANAPKGMEVDHINHDTFDNRKQNLRLCTHQQNAFNRLPHIGTSKYKGVVWSKYHKRWRVRIGEKYVGVFKDEKDAALAYNQAAMKHYGEFAYLNKT